MIALFLLIAQTQSPYTVAPIADASLIVGTGALWLVPELLQHEIVRPSACPCDPAKINAIDRFATQFHSAPLSTASDVMLTAMMALPFAADALDIGITGSKASGLLADSVVMLQALTMTGALSEVTKLAVQRPRPLLYNAPSDAEVKDTFNQLSFFSAHASTAFAMATAYSYTFIRRHPTSVWRFIVPIVTGLIAATTASLRVLSGRHFVTDVATGALVGTAVGLLVPFAHDHGVNVSASQTPQATVLAFGGTF